MGKVSSLLGDEGLFIYIIIFYSFFYLYIIIYYYYFFVELKNFKKNK
jgi:hypothetical protein